MPTAMSMKNNNELSDLIKKIKTKYDLLEKLPVSIKFYEAYSEYRILAEKINHIVEIEKSTKNENLARSPITDNFFGYVNFKVMPILFLLQKEKKALFKKLPANSNEWFVNIQYHFSKLAKMEGDKRFHWWFMETQKVFNDFLDQIETTKTGNKIFVQTNIMNVMHELLDFIKLREVQKNLDLSCLEEIRQNDIHWLVAQYKKLNSSTEKSFSISLSNKGSLGILSLYSEGGNKEDMMQPVYIFQSKLLDVPEAGINLLPSEVVESITLDSITHKLKNTFGKESPKINGQSLKLLKCFFTGNHQTYQCTKALVLEVMRSENKHSGARRQLLSLLRGVADIESIMKKDNKKMVDFYKLVSVKN